MYTYTTYQVTQCYADSPLSLFLYLFQKENHCRQTTQFVSPSCHRTNTITSLKGLKSLPETRITHRPHPVFINHRTPEWRYVEFSLHQLSSVNNQQYAPQKNC